MNFPQIRMLLASLVLSSGIASAQDKPQSKIIVFETANIDAAITSAQTWIKDSTKHGPIKVQQLTIVKSDGKFSAHIEYTEAK